MCEFGEDCDTILTPPEILEAAMEVSNNLLPCKSKKLYEKAYEKFMAWRLSKDAKSFSENVLLAYFQELSKKCKSSTLWTEYSMLNHQTNISNYLKLYAFLKRQAEGFKGKKSKTFLPNEIKAFLDEAPNEQYLSIKVGLIFGIMGACRRQELHGLKFSDVKDLNSAMLVNISNTKTKIDHSFTITGVYYELCKQYMSLRPEPCKVDNFFLRYHNGRCSAQNIGINTFGSMGKTKASYLNLPNSDLYTGHCFRRTSATILVDAGGDITSLKRHGGWKSTSVAEGYIDESLTNKITVSNRIIHSIEKKSIHEPSTSSTHIQAESMEFSTETSTQVMNSNEVNIKVPSSSMQNKRVPVYNFTNCTIQNLHINN